MLRVRLSRQGQQCSSATGSWMVQHLPPWKLPRLNCKVNCLLVSVALGHMPDPSRLYLRQCMSPSWRHDKVVRFIVSCHPAVHAKISTILPASLPRGSSPGDATDNRTRLQADGSPCQSACIIRNHAGLSHAGQRQHWMHKWSDLLDIRQNQEAEAWVLRGEQGCRRRGRRWPGQSRWRRSTGPGTAAAPNKQP